MTLRPEVVRERLALVRRNVARLEETSRMTASAFGRDLKEQWAAAYGLQTTVQSLLDAGAHVLTAQFRETARDYGEIVPLLARHGVIDAELEQRLAGLSGFRNILVHEYAAIDFALVHEKLGRLGDLLALARAIDAWLTANG